MTIWDINAQSLLPFLIIACIVFFSATLFLFIVLANKDEKLQEAQNALNKLLRSFNELDEQAKLIVKTDLELNKAQGQLDQRLEGLNALQRVSQQISQALNEEEIFLKLTPTLFEDLGFARVLAATFDEEQKLRTRLSITYNEAQAGKILTKFQGLEFFKGLLNETHPISSLNGPRKTKEEIIQLFESEHFIFVPITTQSGPLGFIFVGNRLNAPAVTQGDEELISLLAGHIGQVVENAQLFEKVFRSSQELEIKVKERTKQLASALSKVEEINRRKNEFISAVSHELRTPLTSIKGYAAILIAGKIGAIPEAVKERLAKINNHSDNLVSLINNLLDIARIESGHQEMKFASYTPKHIIDNVADLLTPQITAKEINLQVQLPSEASSLYIDLSQAERVLINLLSNAIKFTPKGGTITIGASPIIENGFVTLNVTDTGIGIPPDDLTKLFSEFFRVDNEINQHVKGTGLGLVLAKNIVQAHGGKIWVKSEVNVGTSFYFTLPSTKEAFNQMKAKLV